MTQTKSRGTWARVTIDRFRLGTPNLLRGIGHPLIYSHYSFRYLYRHLDDEEVEQARRELPIVLRAEAATLTTARHNESNDYDSSARWTRCLRQLGRMSARIATAQHDERKDCDSSAHLLEEAAGVLEVVGGVGLAARGAGVAALLEVVLEDAWPGATPSCVGRRATRPTLSCARGMI